MKTQREITDIYALAGELMREHGLTEQGWNFELSNQKIRVGECNYNKKLIRFSIHYLFRTEWDEIRDVILHEIAHALVGSGHGHDYMWRMKCREIGAKPERTCGEEVKSTASPNYYIECSACGKRWPRYRLKIKSHHRSSCCHAELKAYRIIK